MTTDVTFTSAGTTCAGWHLSGVGDDFASERGRPCVVMAHGFGGTRDTGLFSYAEGFAAAGLDVLVFDYRGFGDSAGSPRQHVAFRKQRADYRAAVAAARTLDGVDPDRIVLWGTSYSGGHVLPVTVVESSVVATIALTPATDGLAALVAIARHPGGPRRLGGLVAHGLRDAARRVLRRAPHHVAVVGAPGSLAIMTSPGAYEAYTALAGPTWRNEVCARTALEVGLNRPTRFAARITTPLLVQIGSADSVAPPAAAQRAADAAGARATVLTYPVDHFDVYDGHWQERVLSDQLTFLRRQLGSRAIVVAQGESRA